jgi:tetratricopeptide (TPR) repeat protein
MRGSKTVRRHRTLLVRRIEYTYTGPPMFFRRIFLPFALITALAAAGACAQIDADSGASSAAPAKVPAPAHAAAPAKAVAPSDAATPTVTNAKLQQPDESLSEALLYEFLLGEIAAQRGDPVLAARTYLELARRTRDPRVARRAVELASTAREQGLALEAAQLWHETEPDSIRALQAVTALMIAAKRVDDAEPYLAKLLAAQGTNTASGFMQLNRLLARNPDKNASLRVVRRLAASYPQLPEAHFAVSQAALAAGDEKAALEAIRRASALRPDWDLGALFEAQILQTQSPAKAAERLERYLEQYPDQRDVRMNYARLLVLDKRYPEARQQFERLLADNPGNTEVIFAVGLLAFQLKDYEVAERNLQQLLELNYSDVNTVRYTLGQIAEEQKDWAKAIGWYEKVGAGEQSLPAQLRVANVMAKQGKLDAARAYLHGIVVKDEQQKVQILVAEAQMLREANRNDEAYKLLGRALEQNPDEPDLLYDHALTAEKLEHFDVLETNLRKLIEVRPDHAHAYNALGYSFADRNTRLEEARALIERALELAPNDAFIVDSMGWVLYRQGDAQAAVVQLRRAWSLRPDAEIGAHLGEVLWTSGKRDEANRVWDEALREHPDNETLKKTLRRFRP